MALLYVGSSVAFLWGAAHIIATRSALAGFGTLSTDGRRILVMEWIAEGIALCFIAVLVALVALLGEQGSDTSLIVYRSSAAALFAFAGLAAFTGARTPDLPFKLCPFIEASAGALLLLGSLM
jgi:hypothetical protein